MFSKWVQDIAAIAIISVWVGSFCMTVYDHSYKPPATVEYCMSILAGAAIGKKLIGKPNDPTH